MCNGYVNGVCNTVAIGTEIQVSSFQKRKQLEEMGQTGSPSRKVDGGRKSTRHTQYTTQKTRNGCRANSVIKKREFRDSRGRARYGVAD